MTRHYVDISMPIRNGMVHWPSDPPVAVEPFKSPEKGDRSQVSRLSMGSHTGTHVDAPRHYLPEGKGVEQVPPDHLIGPCRVIDCRGRNSISRRDIAGLDLGNEIRVLFRTDNSDRIARNEFFSDFVFLEESAACCLVDQGVVLVGVDGFSVDQYHAPTPAVHLAFLRAGVTIVEGLLLAGVEAGRYELICLPLRLEGGDGAPARALLASME